MTTRLSNSFAILFGLSGAILCGCRDDAPQRGTSPAHPRQGIARSRTFSLITKVPRPPDPLAPTITMSQASFPQIAAAPTPAALATMRGNGMPHGVGGIYVSRREAECPPSFAANPESLI